jgi:hypothetical protein
MNAQPEINETESSGSNYMRGLAIDAVIFGFHDHQLKVLLMHYKKTGLFALPGGFIHEKENLNDAAKRVVSERSGLTNIYLEQFYAFGDYARYDPASMKSIMTANGIAYDDSHWLLQRFISVGYYALIDFSKIVPAPHTIFDSCDWYEIPHVPKLMQDHNEIVQKALSALRNNLDNTLVASNLMPDVFTMGDLQILYETILDKKLLRPAFQRKMLALGVLERVAKRWTGAAHKAPYLYKFAKN